MKRYGKSLGGAFVSMVAGFCLVLGGCSAGSDGRSLAVASDGGVAAQGSLKVSNAPAGVGGTFVARPQVETEDQGNRAVISWSEAISGGHGELLIVSQDVASGAVEASFQALGSSGNGNWSCGSKKLPGNRSCEGLTVNRVAGTVTFADTVLEFGAKSITLNGVLTFPPF